MKLNKVAKLVLITMTIIMCMPIQASAWLAQDVEKPDYNIGDIRLAMVIRAVAITIPIIYLVMAGIYLKFSEDNKKQKLINSLVWLTITTIVVIGLFYLAKMILGDF